MKRILLALFVLTSPLFAANCAPMMGLGSIQVFDNNGKPLTAGVFYSFQAGTTTQQATYTDSTCTTTNTNPISFQTGGRAAIWLNTGAFYKFQLCAQNDGPACAPADTLFSVDQVPGNLNGSAGSGGSSAPFITGSSNPATSGVLRLASGDSICFRNAANSANLCLSKDASDVVAWGSGAFKLPEISCSNTGVAFDYLCADISAHRWKMANNGGGQIQVVGSGVDINTSDQVTQLHFGSTGTPISGTAPTTGQILQWNGTNLVPYTQESALIWCAAVAACNPLAAMNEINENATEVLFTGAHTIIRFTYALQNSPSGCSTLAILGVRDITTSTTLTSLTIANGQGAGFVDSGALSVATAAGDKIGVGVTQAASGCSVNPQVGNVTAIYQ